MDRITYYAGLTAFVARAPETDIPIQFKIMSGRALRLMMLKSAAGEWAFRAYMVAPPFKIERGLTVRAYQPATGYFFITSDAGIR